MNDGVHQNGSTDNSTSNNSFVNTVESKEVAN